MRKEIKLNLLPGLPKAEAKKHRVAMEVINVPMAAFYCPDCRARHASDHEQAVLGAMRPGTEFAPVHCSCGAELHPHTPRILVAGGL